MRACVDASAAGKGVLARTRGAGEPGGEVGKVVASPGGRGGGATTHLRGLLLERKLLYVPGDRQQKHAAGRSLSDASIPSCMPDR